MRFEFRALLRMLVSMNVSFTNLYNNRSTFSCTYAAYSIEFLPAMTEASGEAKHKHTHILAKAALNYPTTTTIHNVCTLCRSVCMRITKKRTL